MAGFNGLFSGYSFSRKEKSKITRLSIKIEVNRICRIASLIFG
jgi:hypothetical protein